MSTTCRKTASMLAGLALAASLLPAASLGTLAAPATAEAATATAPTLTVSRVNTGKVTLKVKSSYKLGATATKGAKITYSSSKKSVATVSAKGSVTAKKPGKATITVRAKKSGVTTTKKVRVTVVKAAKYKSVKKIYAKAASKAIITGKTTKVSVTFSPKSPSNKNVRFKSSNASVATVSASGTVTSKKTGKATITVTSMSNSKAKASVTITVSTPDLSKISVKPDVESYSWAELKLLSLGIADAGSNTDVLEIAKHFNLVGPDGKLTGNETKSFPMTVTDPRGNTSTKTVYVQILGFHHDDLAGSKGKAGITFGFADIVDFRQMNPTGTNSGGWKSSAMRKYLNGTFYNSLPSDLRSQIVSVSKLTNNKGETSSTSSVTSTSDKVWLLSLTECNGKLSSQSFAPSYPAVYDAEGDQYKLFADNGVNTDNYSFLTKFPVEYNLASWWWLRSPTAEFTDCFHSISKEGRWYFDYAETTDVGVAPGFCI